MPLVLLPLHMDIYTTLYNISSSNKSTVCVVLTEAAFLKQFIIVFYCMYLKLSRAFTRGGFSKWTKQRQNENNSSHIVNNIYTTLNC